MHALGITILLSLFEFKDAMLLLFGVPSGANDEELAEIRSDPVIKLVSHMIQFEPSSRPSFSEVRKVLQNIKTRYTKRMTLRNFKISDESFRFKMQNTLEVTFTVHDCTLHFDQTSLLPVKQDSVTGFDQKDSSLCWAFASQLAIQDRVVKRNFLQFF